MHTHTLELLDSWQPAPGSAISMASIDGARVLLATSGVAGFPRLLHHEQVAPGAPGGFLILELLNLRWECKAT